MNNIDEVKLYLDNNNIKINSSKLHKSLKVTESTVRKWLSGQLPEHFSNYLLKKFNSLYG